MDPQWWNCLPDELITNILARLALIDFQNFRSVCKAWNELAVDREFLRLRATVSCSRPGFALFQTGDDGSELVYLDMDAPNKWRNIPMDFLPCNAALKFLAVSRGLLLLQAVKDSSSRQGDLLVCNPITRAWTKLPRLTVVQDMFYAAMAVDEATGHFVVVAAESEIRDPAVTEVFDSKTGCWRKTTSTTKAGHWKRVAARMSTPWSYGSVPVYCMPVFCKGAFYHLTWDPEDMVSAFPLERGEWKCVKGRGAIPGGVPWGVMEQDGRVLLVEMSYSKEDAAPNEGNTDANLHLWELDLEKLSWERKGRISSPPYKELRIENWRRFVVGDGLVCATFLLPGTMITFSSQTEAQRGMIYDLGEGRWVGMPDLPGTSIGKVSCLFGFKASLSSPVEILGGEKEEPIAT